MNTIQYNTISLFSKKTMKRSFIKKTCVTNLTVYPAFICKLNILDCIDLTITLIDTTGNTLT